MESEGLVLIDMLVNQDARIADGIFTHDLVNLGVDNSGYSIALLF